MTVNTKEKFGLFKPSEELFRIRDWHSDPDNVIFKNLLSNENVTFPRQNKDNIMPAQEEEEPEKLSNKEITPAAEAAKDEEAQAAPAKSLPKPVPVPPAKPAVPSAPAAMPVAETKPNAPQTPKAISVPGAKPDISSASAAEQDNKGSVLDKIIHFISEAGFSLDKESAENAATSSPTTKGVNTVEEAKTPVFSNSQNSDGMLTRQQQASMPTTTNQKPNNESPLRQKQITSLTQTFPASALRNLEDNLTLEAGIDLKNLPKDSYRLTGKTTSATAAKGKKLPEYIQRILGDPLSGRTRPESLKNISNKDKSTLERISWEQSKQAQRNHPKAQLVNDIIVRNKGATEELEKPTYHPYFDSEGNLTVGTGCLISSEKEFTDLKFYDHEGKELSLDEKKAKYQDLMEIKQELEKEKEKRIQQGMSPQEAKKVYNINADIYERATYMYLDDKTSYEFYCQKAWENMTRHIDYLEELGIDINELPPKVQDANFDMVFNIGPTKFKELIRDKNGNLVNGWKKYFEALKRKDYAAMAKECHRLQVPKERNDRVYNLLMEAAAEEEQKKKV